MGCWGRDPGEQTDHGEPDENLYGRVEVKEGLTSLRDRIGLPLGGDRFSQQLGAVAQVVGNERDGCRCGVFAFRDHAVDLARHDRVQLDTPSCVKDFVESGGVGDGTRDVGEELLDDGGLFNGPFSPAIQRLPQHGRGLVGRILKEMSDPEAWDAISRAVLVPVLHRLGELVGEPTFVKVLDFGIAKALAEGDIAGEQTETGLILGTPAYMSPEQVRGKRDIDGRSDLYAVGLIMAECLSGVRVCRGETPFSILAQHTSSDPHDLMPAGRASSLAQIIEQAVAKDADDRFHSATAMREAIEAIPVDSLSDSPAPAVMVDVSGPANTGPTVTPSASSQKPDRQMQIGAAIPDDETVGAVVSITSEPSPTPSRILALILLVVLVGSAAVVAWIAGQTPDPAPGPGPATDTRATSPEPELADDDRRGQTGDEDASALAQDADADETTHHGSGPSQDLVSAVLSFTVAQERVYSALPRVRSIAFEGTEGARVYLDDQTIGSVPFSVPFPALDVQLAVRAERDGFRTRAIDFSLTQDNVTVVLRRQRQTAEAEPAERDPEPPENENDMGSGGDEADAQETDLPFGLMPIYDNSP